MYHCIKKKQNPAPKSLLGYPLKYGAIIIYSHSLVGHRLLYKEYIYPTLYLYDIEPEQSSRFCQW